MADEEDAGRDARGEIEKRTRIFLEGVDPRRDPLVDKVERTGVGLGGMSQEVEIRLRRATGCHHVMHTGSELGAVCAGPGCNNVLCSKCGEKEENVCAACGRTVCGACKRRIWLRAEHSVLCPACARRWWLRELLVASGAGALAILALWFLLFR